jgi:hypothetical protein
MHPEESWLRGGAAVAGSSSPTSAERNVNVDQAKLDRVRELPGSTTETEASVQAFEMLLFREELRAGVVMLHTTIAAIQMTFVGTGVPCIRTGE